MTWLTSDSSEAREIELLGCESGSTTGVEGWVRCCCCWVKIASDVEGSMMYGYVR